MTLFLALSIACTAHAGDFAAALAARGFALLTHGGTAPPPQFEIAGATRDVFVLPVEGPAFTVPAGAGGTLVLGAGQLPPPPPGALGWRVSMQFASDDPNKPKRTGYAYVAGDAITNAHTFTPPGTPGPTATLHTRAVFPVRATQSLDLGALPPSTQLHTDFALSNDWRAEAAHGARFVISIAVDDAVSRVVHEETITMGDQAEAVPPWRTMDLDLSAYSGHTVKLFLDTYDAAAAPTPNFAVPLWGDPVVYRTAKPEVPLAPPGVLLVSLDTVRADRLGCYGYPRGTTPHLDALAAESYLFENALTPAPMTTPAHASVLIGVSPYQHRAGVYSEGFRLTNHWAPLATLLTERGYRAAAFTEGIALAGSIGFARGFQSYSDGPSPQSHDRDIIGMTFADAAAWLARFGHLPSFLFVHTYHAHDPYTAPDRILNRFTDPAYLGRSMSQPKDAKTPEEKRNASDCYDAGLAYTDEKFGEFLQGLKDSGRLQNRWLIVFSDHGEEFWEHGSAGHARALYRESVHVPLLIRPPDGVPGGKRIADPVLITDLFATLLTITGTPVPPDRDSHDLLSLVQGKDAAREMLPGFFRGYEFPRFGQGETKEWETFCLRTPAYTYITTAPKWQEPPGEELFAPEDLGEQFDLGPTRPDLLEAARKAQREHRDVEDRQRRAPEVQPALKPNEVDALRGLGYF